MMVRVLPVLGVALVASLGCGKKSKTSTGPAPAASSNVRDGVEVPEVGRGLASEAGSGSMLARVQFEFDSTTLTRAAKEDLRAVGRTLQDSPALTLRIEGHADERGTTQYNLALSERRAAAVRAFLTDLGVASHRLETVGLGEERPLATGEGEAAWARNRRAELMTTGGGDKLVGNR